MPIVKAPLVIAKDAAGQDVYLYFGTDVPASIDKAEVERLSEFFDFGDADTAKPKAGEPSLARPAESGPGSSKDKWLAYAEFNGVEIDDDADKADIVSAVTAAGF